MACQADTGTSAMPSLIFLLSCSPLRQEQIGHWVSIHGMEPIMPLKTLKKTLLNIIFNKDKSRLPTNWNAGNCFMAREEATQFKILHFSGFDGKPWDNRSNCYEDVRALWNHYFLSHSYVT